MINIIFCSPQSPLTTNIKQSFVQNNIAFNEIEAGITKFKDNEIFANIQSNVRNEIVFVVHSANHTPNDDIMEFLIVVDALKRASAKEIIAIIPYFYYARQDRKSELRSPITAKLYANLLESAGVNKIITMDLHVSQIQGFFNIPVDNIYFWPAVVEDLQLKFKDLSNTVVTSPDVGGIMRARSLAKKINTQIIIIDKRREKPGTSEVMNIIGDVNGKDCIIFDDILDSGGTLCNAAEAIMQKGANSVVSYITHGIFSSNAVDRIESSAIQNIYVSDTINNQNITNNKATKIKVISSGGIFANVINQVVMGRSISKIFNS
jgi:ribose-phosphate pyrophosphokinase